MTKGYNELKEEFDKLIAQNKAKQKQMEQTSRWLFAAAIMLIVLTILVQVVR